MKELNELQAKIDQVHDTIVKEEGRFHRSLTKTMMFYGLIVVVMIGYIIFLNIKVYELATPRNLAITINSNIKNMIPRFHLKLKEGMEPQAKQAAKKTVGLLNSGIPYVKEMLKAQVNIYTNKMLNDLEQKQMPKVKAAIDGALTKAVENKDLVKDKGLGKVLATNISKELDRELAQIVDKPFIDALDKLHEQIKILRYKKRAELTRKEAAERKMIATWIYLVDHQTTGEGIFSEAVQLLNASAGKVSSEI